MVIAKGNVMQFISIISLLLLSLSVFPNEHEYINDHEYIDEFEKFNQEMNQNIEQVVEDNPQLYETEPLEAKPKKALDEDESLIQEEQNIENLDEIDEQGNTSTFW